MTGWLRVAAIIALGALAAEGAGPSPARFDAAAYVSEGIDGDSRLVIFPGVGNESSIHLPLTLRYIAFGASGESLYATAFQRLDEKSFTTAPGLLKIGLNPVKVSRLPGFDDFDGINSFAVSRAEDKIVFSGARHDGNSRRCGVFEVSLPSGSMHPVLQTPDCIAGGPWRVVDLAPDSQEAVIKDLSRVPGTLVSSDPRLKLLDLQTAAAMPLEKELWKAAYSPDGKWIAALQLGEHGVSKTFLIDRKDLSRRRDLGLGIDELVWSPDSQFILHAVYRPACIPGGGNALETIEIKTGTRTVLKNSICDAGSGLDIGWVSRRAGAR
ncbi:MAG TPA: hypothetical protein VH639_23265 [Bryobacteraceae bacterium]